MNVLYPPGGVLLPPNMFLTQGTVPPIKVCKICIRLEVKAQAGIIYLYEKVVVFKCVGQRLAHHKYVLTKYL